MRLEAWKLCLIFVLLTNSAGLIPARAQGQGSRPAQKFEIEDVPPSKQPRPFSTRELAAKVRKSLVVILTQDSESNIVAQGSGFFLRPGLIATNLHVLKRASGLRKVTV